MLVELRAVAAHAGRVAGGDLSGQMEPRSERDELRRSLSAMTDGLRSMVSDLSVAAETVATQCRAASSSTPTRAGRAVDEIARAVAEVASGAERQGSLRSSRSAA